MNLKYLTRDDVIALLVANGQPPSESMLRMYQQRDRMNNQYNETHKPPIRSEEEIIADYKIENALMTFDRLAQSLEKERQ